MKYATIFNSVHLWEISIIRNLLEENNIDYKTPDEATNSATGIAGLGIRGMRVLVPEEQRERAISILRDRGFVVG